MSLSFRWLGVAGVELRAGGHILAIDPFFTRPGLEGLIKPVPPNTDLVAEKMPVCEFVLVTHSHWDHVLDVPVVARQTGAQVFGSENTCQLLLITGVKGSQVHEVKIGEKLSLEVFEVEVIAGQHSSIPFARLFNGSLHQGLQPPLRLQEYRMDICLGYYITVMGQRILVCAAQPQPAEVLFAVAQEERNYYLRLIQGVQPDIFVPIHWDNFLRPLSKRITRFARPDRLQLWQLERIARQAWPGINVIVPEIFREYTL